MKKLYKKTVIPASLLVLGGLSFLVDLRTTDMLAGVFWGAGLYLFVRHNMPKSGKWLGRMQPSRPHAADNLLPERAEAAVEKEVAAAVQGTPLGAEFRKKLWLQTETAVDGMLDAFVETICGKLSLCTAAVFFPAQNNCYALRRYRSKSEFVNAGALICPRRGILGSLLTEGLRPFYEPNFTNKNATLYYYDEERDFPPEESIRSIMLHPIEAEGEVRGLLLADSTLDNAFSKDDQAFLGNIAGLMGQSIYYTYLNTAHNLDYQRLAAMSSIEKDFWNDLEFDAVMDKMCEIIPTATPCGRLTISLKNEEKMSASVVRAHGEDAKEFLNLEFKLGGDNMRSIASLAYSKDFGFFRNFTADRYEFRYSENEPRSKSFASFMVIPFGVGTLKGLILIESAKADAFSNFNLDLLWRLGMSAGLALEKIFLLKEAEARATHDGLTGLCNHRQFQKILATKLSACKRYNSPLSLVLCDIDYFKKLNDTYGHPFGDIVLKGVAKKLEECIRVDIDAAARYGGEEFVLIFDKTDTNTAKESAERIRQAIESLTFKTTDGATVKTSMSFGIASYPQHGRENNELIDRADKALYSAKQNGRNRVEVY